MSFSYKKQLKNLQEFYCEIYIEAIEKKKLETDQIVFWQDIAPDLSNVNKIFKFIMKNKLHFCTTDNDLLYVAEHISRKISIIYSLNGLDRLDLVHK